MANKNKINIKRFIENVSKEVAQDAYEGGGSGGKILTATINYGTEWRYSSTIKFACTTSSISTFKDLVNWLKENGYNSSENSLPFISEASVYVDQAHSGDGDPTNCNLLAVVTYKGVEGILLNGDTPSESNILFEANMPSDFSITFLGN